MIDLRLGDCLELMKDIPDNSVDCVLTDPPYGTTQCRWDTVIDFELMWEQLKRIVKDNGAICLFGSEPFSSHLRLSNIKMFKYDWVWHKDKATNHLNCKKQPMRRNEIISVFYKKQCLYIPQIHKKDIENIRPKRGIRKNIDNYGAMDMVSALSIPISMGYPNETLNFNGCSGGGIVSRHPTQKPVKLLEYLIKTYTLENETVLDFTFGSGSTAIACINTNRKFIGIEKDEDYFDIAKERIKNHEVKSDN